MRRIVIAAAAAGLGFMAMQAFTQRTKSTANAKAYVQIDERIYTQDQIDMSDCIANGGKAYFCPVISLSGHVSSKYIGCNVHPKSGCP